MEEQKKPKKKKKKKKPKKNAKAKQHAKAKVEHKVRFCILCRKPIRTKSELCVTCKRKKVDAADYVLEATGRELYLSNSRLIAIKNRYHADDVFAFIKSHPYDAVYARFDRYKSRGEKNAIKKVVRSDRYSEYEYKKDEYIIPKYIEDMFKKIPGYTLLTTEGSVKDPYIYCQCKRCGSEIKALYSDFKRTQGHDCESVISSGEAIVTKFLEDNSIPFKTQRKTLKCVNPKTGRVLPYDFELTGKKIIIEVQGDQHIKFIESFHGTVDNFEYQQWRDRYKKEYAIKKGYRFIEIFYDEFDNREFERKINEALNWKSVPPKPRKLSGNAD